MAGIMGGDLMRNAMTDSYGRPDWVMCGMPWNGGVRLLASKDMTHAELEAKFDHVNVECGLVYLPVLAGHRITLTAGMSTFIVIDAPDYPSAFAALFEQWTPGPADRVALPGIPAIEAP
jgi:hypothetical protein